MNCPVCKSDEGAMVIVEHEQIELDYCPNCTGVWFDYGELDLLLERLVLDSSAFSMGTILALPEKGVKEARRKCPICRKKMKKTVVGSEPEVLIDVCPRGDGIWFDGGEVQQVISQLVNGASVEGSGEGKVISFMGQVFKASSQ